MLRVSGVEAANPHDAYARAMILVKSFGSVNGKRVHRHGNLYSVILRFRTPSVATMAARVLHDYTGLVQSRLGAESRVEIYKSSRSTGDISL